LKEAEKRIEVTRKIISQAKENFRIVQERYREGRATNTEVLDAQTLLSEARTRYFQSLYNYDLARAKLKRATGMESTDAEK
jgi:outer membrane protein TolC